MVDKLALGSNLNEPISLKDQVNDLRGLTIGVMVVLGIIVIGFFYQYLAQEATSYNDLGNKVHEQNTQIQILTNEIKDLRDFMEHCNAWRTSSC